MTAMSSKIRRWVITSLVVLALFGIPAVLVRVTMEDVPQRSETRVQAVYVNAINTVEAIFVRHQQSQSFSGRLQPIPTSTHDWVELLNPMGRKAPGGGFMILPEASDKTGAIGVAGDNTRVVVTMPAYRDLNRESTVIELNADL